MGEEGRGGVEQPALYALELHEAAGERRIEAGPSISDPMIAAGVLSWVAAGGVSHSEPLPAGG